MRKLDNLNFYELLEIGFDAAPFEIHHAYKEMHQLYHGDSLATYSFFSKEDREKILIKLEEAYSTLMDDNKRSRYDQLLIERGILEEGMQYQKSQRKLSLISDAQHPNTNMALIIRNRLKPIVSSNPTIQEILKYDVLSGKDLRKIREELGISLEEIAEMAKVRMVYLQSIEEDQFEKTPPGIFLKSFLKAYAQCMGLDADSVANRYLKRVHN